MKCPTCGTAADGNHNLVSAVENILAAHRFELAHGGRVYTDEAELLDALATARKLLKYSPLFQSTLAALVKIDNIRRRGVLPATVRLTQIHHVLRAILTGTEKGNPER